MRNNKAACIIATSLLGLAGLVGISSGEPAGHSSSADGKESNLRLADASEPSARAQLGSDGAGGGAGNHGLRLRTNLKRAAERG